MAQTVVERIARWNEGDGKPMKGSLIAIFTPDRRQRVESQQGYRERAQRITDRVMPEKPLVNGFLDPEGFIARSQHQSARKRLYWRTYARLRAKAEGGLPRIRVPKHSEHLWGPGDAMFDVARELEREAELAMLDSGLRRFHRAGGR